MSKIITTLPANGAGSWIGNGAVPLANGILDTEDIYTWLGDVILPSIFQDAVCGDGTCDELQEEKGIGQFGWCDFSCFFVAHRDCAQSDMHETAWKTVVLLQKKILYRW